MYRMVNLLEEIGAISRVNLYEVTYVAEKRPEEHVIELDEQFSTCVVRNGVDQSH